MNSLRCPSWNSLVFLKNLLDGKGERGLQVSFWVFCFLINSLTSMSYKGSFRVAKLWSLWTVSIPGTTEKRGYNRRSLTSSSIPLHNLQQRSIFRKCALHKETADCYFQTNLFAIMGTLFKQKTWSVWHPSPTHFPFSFLMKTAQGKNSSASVWSLKGHLADPGGYIFLWQENEQFVFF